MNPKIIFLVLSSSLFLTLQAAQFTDSSLGERAISSSRSNEETPKKATVYFTPRRLITDGKAPAEF